MSEGQWEAGRILQTAREAAGISKRTAAARAEMSESWWRKIEAGQFVNNGVVVTTRAQPEALVRAARAVGADVRSVLVAAGAWTGDEPPTPSTSAARAKLNGLLDRLDDKDVALVSAYVHGLLANREG